VSFWSREKTALAAALGVGCDAFQQPAATYTAPSPRGRPTKELKNDETVIIKPPVAIKPAKAQRKAGHD
jgi:hypothetical protein